MSKLDELKLELEHAEVSLETEMGFIEAHEANAADWRDRIADIHVCIRALTPAPDAQETFDFEASAETVPQVSLPGGDEEIRDHFETTDSEPEQNDYDSTGVMTADDLQVIAVAEMESAQDDLKRHIAKHPNIAEDASEFLLSDDEREERINRIAEPYEFGDELYDGQPIEAAPATNPEADALAAAHDYYAPENVAKRDRFNPFTMFHHKRETEDA